MKTKYQYGTTAASPNNAAIDRYLKTPAEAIQDSQQMIAQAKAAAANDPLANTIGALGQLATTASSFMGGGAMAGQAAIPEIASVASKAAPAMTSMSGPGAIPQLTFAYGGVAGQEVEIEGKEVVEFPNGAVDKAEGPSHENGGIDLFLPDGSIVYSDRIKVGNKTVAERKEARENKMSKLAKMLEDNPTDKINKNTYDRQKAVLDKEDETDLKLQAFISKAKETEGKVKMAYGGMSGGQLGRYLDFMNPEIPEQTNLYSLESIPTNQGIAGPGEINIPTNVDYSVADPTFGEKLGAGLNKIGEGINSAANSNVVSNAGDFLTGNMGDLLGQAGNLYSMIAPMRHTKNVRAGDQPFENYMSGYGERGLESLDQAGENIGAQEAKALQDLNLDTLTQRKRARSSARGANTQRALDLAIEQQKNRAQADIYASTADRMSALLQAKAAMQNQQDQVVMTGAAQADQLNRAQRDAYDRAMAQNISGVGQGIQQIGKELNQSKVNNILEELLKQRGTYVGIDTNKGTLTNK